MAVHWTTEAESEQTYLLRELVETDQKVEVAWSRIKESESAYANLVKYQAGLLKLIRELTLPNDATYIVKALGELYAVHARADGMIIVTKVANGG